MTAATRLQNQIGRLGLTSKLQRRWELRQSINKLERELGEVDQKIAIWDRLVFFSDTEDEAQKKLLADRVKEQTADWDAVTQELESAFEKIGTNIPPFAIGCALEGCLQSARSGLDVGGLFFKHVEDRGDLEGILESLANRVIELYAPDFDQQSLYEQLTDQSRCESIARDADDGVLQGDDSLGIAPLSMNRLLPLCAERLLESGFFETRARHQELIQDERDLRKQYEEAKEAVPFLDKLNVFTDSDLETERKALKEEYKSVQESRESCYEQNRGQLHKCLSVYPPLDFYQRLLEAAAVTRLLKVGEERTLSMKGEIVAEKITSPRMLLIAALNRLMSKFAETFRGVQLPNQLVDKTNSTDHRPDYVRKFFKNLEGSDVPHFCKEALSHACLQGHIDRQIKETAQQISLIDRLVFWSDTKEEAEEDQLQYRNNWNKDWTQVLWNRLLEEAALSATQLGPFSLRDNAIESIESIGNIHTDSGSSSSPMSCSVYGRGEAQKALRSIKRGFEDCYHLQGNRDDLLETVYQLTERGVDPVSAEDEGKRFGQIHYDDLAFELARRLTDSRFNNLYGSVRKLTNKLDKLEIRKDSAESKISLWDCVNIFTTTPDEGLRNQLKAEISVVDKEAAPLLNELNALFNKAIQIYPAALHYFEINAVIIAVNRISASCQSYTVSRGSGDNKTTETRYRCVLNGHGTAKSAMRHWAAAMVKHFGRLPGYHELLEEWELTRAGGSDEVSLEKSAE
jgi:hypothetical protein